jgi:hypothetical protein
MLTEVKNNYKSILKHFDFDESVSYSDFNKQKLIEMAINRKPRPSQKTKMGRVLSEYTKKSGDCFDVDFYRSIRKIRPDWFVSQKQIANQKKKKLIEMAKNGKKRPAYEKTRLGQALSNYTRKSSTVYDPIFDKTIRKLRPDWFDLALLRNNNAH